MSSTHVHVVLGAFLAFTLIGTAQADILGSIWENDTTGASDAIPSNVPLTTPNVTFSVANGALDFKSNGTTDYTIGSFLGTGGATILTGSGDSNKTLNETLFNITGTVSVTNGETFTAGHDDGLTLIIDGITVISAPGPTSFTDTTETYTGPTGTYAFQLVYGETAGAPADLVVDLPLVGTIPEPSSLPLLGVMLLGLAPLALKRKFAS